jgi:hypothetical protein
MRFEEIASLLSVVGGVISLLGTLLGFLSARRSQISKLREAEEKQFQAALASDDLTVVGNYLEENIGRFNVYEYVSNPTVSKRIDTYLERLRFFVGTDAELEQQIRESEPPPEIEVPSALPEEFERVLTELRTGEIWNALARLRRYIEIALREIAEARDIRLERPSTAGHLLNVLWRSEVIPQDAFSNLKYAITVCNKAVHGIDVDMSEAEEALLHASVGMRRLTNYTM